MLVKRKLISLSCSLSKKPKKQKQTYRNKLTDIIRTSKKLYYKKKYIQK